MLPNRKKAPGPAIFSQGSAKAHPPGKAEPGRTRPCLGCVPALPSTATSHPGHRCPGQVKHNPAPVPLILPLPPPTGQDKSRIYGFLSQLFPKAASPPAPCSRDAPPAVLQAGHWRASSPKISPQPKRFGKGCRHLSGVFAT